jgi:transposase InsO family protein
MQVYGSILPGAATLARLLPEGTREARQRKPQSREARQRQKVLAWHKQNGERVSLTARHFGYSRTTIYELLKRRGRLDDRSRRPRRVRQPTWSGELEARVLALRQANPRWGKDTLTPILRREGVQVSVSMVGRILGKLRREGRLLPATTADPNIRSISYQRPHAQRKPREYVPLAPGDLVQVDSADVRWTGLPHGYKHFSARDYISRWDVLGVYGRATAVTAASFLEELQDRMPFPVRAIQVDGGSEFKAEFEAACAAKGLLLFVLPPRSPKLNGRVERAQRTHKEEFYQVIEPPDGLADLRPQLLLQEQRYNTYRPHHALGFKTPQEWLLAFTERG